MAKVSAHPTMKPEQFSQSVKRPEGELVHNSATAVGARNTSTARGFSLSKALKGCQGAFNERRGLRAPAEVCSPAAEVSLKDRHGFSLDSLEIGEHGCRPSTAPMHTDGTDKYQRTCYAACPEVW